jgi:hypothetical protein
MITADARVRSDSVLVSHSELSISARAVAEGRIPFLTTVALFVTTYLVFCVSPIINTSDSMYSMLLSESILQSGSTNLNQFHFPDPVVELKTSTPPIDDPRNPRSYQIAKVRGNIVYCYPNGSSILSVPFVALMNALGISPASADRSFNEAGELAIQKTLAALLMSLLTCIVFRTALIMLSPAPSVVIALGFAFGTQVFSTGTRALWSSTWFIFLGGLVAYHILSAEVERRSVQPIWLATVLSWIYFVRPTGAIAIACVSIYIFVCERGSFIRYATTGAAWLVGFVAYSWMTYGELIPGYYRSRFGPREFWIGVYGNLLSPSRGLLIYVPALAFVIYLVVRYWKSLPQRHLAVLSIAAIAANLLAIAAYPCWWGGYCYGARLMMDALPWFAVLAILGCAAASVGRASVLSRGELAIAMMLLALSFAINGRGAFSTATQQWSTVVDIDKHPERALDWSYPQFAAGLVSPPDYVIENTSRARAAVEK